MKNTFSTQFEEKISAAIKLYSMVQVGDRILVAVSGGPDSVALLFALTALGSGPTELGIFHLDHGLRAESAAEARQVEALADRLGLRSYMERENIKDYCDAGGLSIQEGARLRRYELLEQHARQGGFNKIATGHNANDVAETLLMRLIRGGGLAGLASIPPVRGCIIRPLIDVDRSEILGYLDSIDEGFVSDPSNDDRKYFRNRVSAEIVPLLTEMNPNFIARTRDNARMIADEEAIIDGVAQEAFEGLAETGEDEILLELEGLRSLEPALGRRVIRKALISAGGDLKDIDFSHTERIWANLVKGRESAVQLPGPLTAVRDGRAIVCYREHASLPLTSLGPGDSAQSAELTAAVTIRKREDVDLDSGGDRLYLDAATVAWPLVLRSAMPGDSWRPLGLGGSKKVHEYLIDQKIPRRRRVLVPVSVDQEKVVGVGYRPDDRAKVTGQTIEVAVIEMTAGGI